MKEFGGPGGTNVEPFEASNLLEELETWAEVLKSEPEFIHRLAAFAEAAEDDAYAAGDLDSVASGPVEPSP